MPEKISFPPPKAIPALKAAIIFLALLLTVVLTGCGKSRLPGPSQKPSEAKDGTYREYTIGSKRYRPMSSSTGYTEKGIASWYGKKFHGKTTANGESYDMYAMTAAHKVLPMNTRVRVTNVENSKSIVVRINDRGPFVKDRVIDLSYAAAQKLEVVGPGTARVRLEALGECPRDIAGEFYVQVGSFTVKPNAQYLEEKLKERGYSASRIVRAELNNRTFWRVQAGKFSSLSRARQAAGRLESNYPEAFVIAD
ncbi:MAG: septal ring lytic transglycosylase RlpA family protein [Desulfonatronovibrionaceae bacterium]